jgi:hypothetical protein
MKYVIVDVIIGLLLGSAAIGIPQLVRKRRQRPDHQDTDAYLQETGRSVQDIEQGNAVVESEQENDARSQQASSPGSERQAKEI